MSAAEKSGSAQLQGCSRLASGGRRPECPLRSYQQMYWAIDWASVAILRGTGSRKSEKQKVFLRRLTVLFVERANDMTELIGMNGKPQGGQRRWLRQLLLAAGIIVGLSIMALIHMSWGGADPVRQTAWEKIAPRLSSAEQTSLQAGDKYAGRVSAFFAERKRAARAFAEEALSLSGKWAFVKSKLPWTDADGHDRFIRQSFERLLFKGEDIKELIESTVRGYVSELEGIESAMLVDIRADLSEGDLGPPDLLPALRSDESFQKSYAQMAERVFPVVQLDMGVTVARELSSFMAADIAANVSVRILTAVTVRLGLSGGILGSGAVLSVETFGAGLVAALLVDKLIDVVMHQAGYDPEGDIAFKVCEALDKVEAMLLDGEPESGTLGLRGELLKLQQARSKLCNEALKKLIFEGGQ
jgi:hypothetical protein